MYKLITTLLLSTALAGTAAWAADYQPSGQAGDVTTQPNTGQQPGEVGADQAVGVTERKAPEMGEKGYLRDEIVGIRPQLGTLVFKDLGTGNTNARGAIGLTADMNAVTTFTDNKDWYLGPSTGFIYSHLGASDANFFGANSTSANQGANAFYIPLNAKVGYNLTQNARVALHGGGNLIFRSIPTAMSLSNNDATKAPNDWTVFPNLGADFEYGFGKSAIALLVRPDVTFASANNMFSGTVAVSIPLS
jgi:hypothetical protein